MNIVIDIQGVRDRCNAFIPKEIAIVSVHSDYSAHWIVSAPHSYNSLPPSIKRQNTWLIDSYHGIEWSDGETTLRAIETALKKIAVQADRIFTRGAEKAAYLAHLTDCFIINLEEDIEDPSFRNLPECETLCIYHSLLRRKKSTYKCALNHAVKIKEWLRHSSRIASLWEYRTTTTWSVGLSELGGGNEKKYHPEKKANTTNSCYEQPANIAGPSEHTESRRRRVPCRSHPEGVDETDSYRC